MASRPSTKKPTAVRLRTYQVGFGDCFLLTIEYGTAGSRHVLIDFGSTAKPKTAPPDLLERIARDVATCCKNGQEPLAVVATHRHKDHISGFARKKSGKGSGDIIRALKPHIVVQPWTEDPKAKPKARVPSSKRTNSQAMVTSLAGMQSFAAYALHEAAGGAFPAALTERVKFLGDDAISNRSAVENLMTMGRKKAAYVYFGSSSGLETHLPGVTTRVLGPPTLEQTEEIRTQRQRDDEFWHLLGLSAPGVRGTTRESPFAAYDPTTDIPPAARWFVRRSNRLRGNQLLRIVRALDDALNNTSLILLFQIAGLNLLFPGDAQIENWEYALKTKRHQARVQGWLRDVKLYKVGHHGSLNATPKSLWSLFQKRGGKSKPDRLVSVMSTMKGKHGSSQSGTEVPRSTLVAALKKDSDHFTTESLGKSALFEDRRWTRQGNRWVLE